MSLDILLFVSNKYKNTVSKEILVHAINSLKTTKRFWKTFFDRWYYFITTFFNFSSSFTFVLKIWCKTLLASYQFLQISIVPPLLNNDWQVLLGSKYIFVQHLTISVLFEVSVGWRIVERFNTCNLILIVVPFVSCTC